MGHIDCRFLFPERAQLVPLFYRRKNRRNQRLFLFAVSGGCTRLQTALLFCSLYNDISYIFYFRSRTGLHRPYFSAGSTFTNSQAFGRHSKQSGFCFPLRGSLRAAPIACSHISIGLWLDRYFRFTITVMAHKATSLFYGSMVIRSTFFFYFIQIFTDLLRKASSRVGRHARAIRFFLLVFQIFKVLYIMPFG